MFTHLRLVGALTVATLALPLVHGATASAATKAPGCIVSLSPTASDTLFSIGAGAQVQAVDQDSTFPAAAARVARAHKINPLEPSVEAILGVCKVTAAHPSRKPDLVVISYDPSDFAKKLTNLGVKVVEQDAPGSLGGALAQIRALGVLTGHATAADALAARMNAAINADVKSLPAHPTKKVTVYYEISSAPYYSVTSSTFVGSLMKRLGLVNIADAQSTSADAGYPELTSEYIVSTSPTLILLAGDASVASVGQRTGFASVSAVEHHHVVELNANQASQWGPQLVPLMHQLTTSVASVLGDSSLWG